MSLTEGSTMIFAENPVYKVCPTEIMTDQKILGKKSTQYVGVKACRACLTQNDNELFLLVPSGQDISEASFKAFMFISCTSLEVSWDDRYPKHICAKCLNELSQAYEFFEKCRNSVAKFDTYNAVSTDIDDDITLNEDSDLDLGINDNDNHLDVEISTHETDVASKKGKKKFKQEPNEEHSNFTKVDTNIKTEDDDKKDIKFRRCKKCNMSFPNRAEYARHAKHHNKYLCPVCGYFCVSIGGLHAHSASHSNVRPYKCQVCSKQYKSQSSLHVHMRNHTGERRYTCDQCGIKFITWNSLHSHIKTHHSTARPYVCEICMKSFKQSSTLKIHRRQHTGEKPYPCTECPMAFKSSSDLKGHMVKHTGERNYPCTLCEKRFTKPYNLKQHMVTHTGERKHKCEICSRAFTQAHVLRGHMKIHRDIQIPIVNIS